MDIHFIKIKEISISHGIGLHKKHFNFHKLIDKKLGAILWSSIKLATHHRQITFKIRK